MTVETDQSWERVTAGARVARKPFMRLMRIADRLTGYYRFTSLTRRIVVLNTIGLVILVTGSLYLNQFRAGLIDAKVESLLTQGEIIAGAIAAQAGLDTDRVAMDAEKLLESDAASRDSLSESDVAPLEFSINPEQAAPILRRLVKPTGTRARIYDRNGSLVLDSETLYTRGQILSYDLDSPEEQPNAFERILRDIRVWLRRQDLPIYKEIGAENGKAYPEVGVALNGQPMQLVRVNEKGELIVSVAVPIQRMRAVLGVMLLSTQGGDIDNIVSAERWGIVRVSSVAIGVTLLLSLLLAQTIAGPMRRLSAAADNVRRSVKGRQEIPDYTDRSDEIGHLSGALRDMTNALYRRMDAIESFAADVAHEIKNPLTSLRSAVETLPLAKDEETRTRLLEIIQHDVRRLDRLISDISDASRLDAELARDDTRPVDMVDLVTNTVAIFNDIHRDDTPAVELIVAPYQDRESMRVTGHDSRLGQIVVNLLDNAISFSPKEGRVQVGLQRLGKEIEVTIDDEGPGIAPDNLERIFERFYTDRPGEDQFGQNSGLGLNISRQIVVAHGGKIWAENRNAGPTGRRVPVAGSRPGIAGARLVIRLPAA